MPCSQTDTLDDLADACVFWSNLYRPENRRTVCDSDSRNALHWRM
jgi:hypothetical protein